MHVMKNPELSILLTASSRLEISDQRELYFHILGSKKFLFHKINLPKGMF